MTQEGKDEVVPDETVMSEESQHEEAATADFLLGRLLHCDDQLAEVLTHASEAVDALGKPSKDEVSQSEIPSVVEASTQKFLSTLNDIQVTMKEAAHALREARLSPLTPPAVAHTRLSGEAGVAASRGPSTESSPYSLSTLQLRADAWRHVVESLRAATEVSSAETRALLAALAKGAEVRSDSL